MKNLHKLTCAIDCIDSFSLKYLYSLKKRPTFVYLKIHNHNTIP